MNGDQTKKKENDFPPS